MGPQAGDLSAEKIWSRYFETVAESARSGLFDIIAHPDLVKIWGSAHPERVPDRDLRFYYEPAVEAIAEAGVAVEVSTAGLRKPVGEIYPARAFLEMCLEAGLPIALSSDAHRPADVGAGYEQALELLDELGVRELSVFEHRQRRLEPVGACDMRVGLGYDSHRLAEGRRLILGGVEIPYERGLDGHSDSDVLAHAVIDALLGAAGLGDIGQHFPDTDERWRGADSIAAAGAGRRDARRARPQHRERRLHGDHGGAEGLAPPRGDPRAAGRGAGRRRAGR